jgi:hypothetical protein
MDEQILEPGFQQPPSALFVFGEGVGHTPAEEILWALPAVCVRSTLSRTWTWRLG